VTRLAIHVRRSGVVRAAALMVLVVLLLPLAAAPASAHGRGSDASNFQSTVTGDPQIPGAVWEVYGGDELLSLESPDHEVMVLGYSDEPYLRVGPDGVFRNENSPATYLNEDRYRIDLPSGVTADPDRQPAWEHLGDHPSYAWHDHRVHLMTTALPSQVAEDPGTRHLVQSWSVPVVVDGQELAVEGELAWVPGPSPWPWLLAGLLLTLPALIGVRAQDLRRLVRPAALTLGLVALVNVTRVVDDVFAMPMPAATIAFAVVQTVLFLVIGSLGAVKAWRGGDGAFTALAVGSASILVGQGLLYLSVLSASQLTSVFPDGLGRLTVAVSLAQALTVGAVAVIGNRRMMPSADDTPAESPSYA
jgi:hypothetical protein